CLRQNSNASGPAPPAGRRRAKARAIPSELEPIQERDQTRRQIIRIARRMSDTFGSKAASNEVQFVARQLARLSRLEFVGGQVLPLLLEDSGHGDAPLSVNLVVLSQGFERIIRYSARTRRHPHQASNSFSVNLICST